jgi:transcriptional regulator EpsA
MAAFDLSEDERNSLVRVIQQSLGLQTQTDVFLWLHGEMQRFLPHETLLVAWGDFANGQIHLDVISAVPGVCTPQLEGLAMSGLVRRLFDSWVQYGCKPLVLESSEGFHGPDNSGRCFPTRSLMQMRSVVIHGIRDQRGGQDCAYFAFNKQAVRDAANARAMIEVLTPYIDNSLRWVQELPEQKMSAPHSVDAAPETSEVGESLGLSMREIEIMDWVRKGKTNQEIGMILSISVFTVKNHLQRVFRKLNVLNRAQAVARTSEHVRVERA